MTRILFFFGLLILFAACDGGATAPEVKEQPIQSAVGPEPQEPGFYIGRWARDAKDCGDRAWIFSADRLVAAPGVCVFKEITKVAEGVDIAADCSWDDEMIETQMRLSWAESARALLVMHGPDGDLGLVACPVQAEPSGVS